MKCKTVKFFLSNQFQIYIPSVASVSCYFEKKRSFFIVWGVIGPLIVEFEKPFKYKIIRILGFLTFSCLDGILLRKVDDHKLQRGGGGVIGPPKSNYSFPIKINFRFIYLQWFRLDTTSKRKGL
jgi:hypothetical protein